MVLLTVLVALIGQIGQWDRFLEGSEYLFRFLKDVVSIPFSLIISFYFLKRIVQK